jgi:hypothetical protein
MGVAWKSWLAIQEYRLWRDPAKQCSHEWNQALVSERGCIWTHLYPASRTVRSSLAWNIKECSDLEECLDVRRILLAAISLKGVLNNETK